MADEVKEKLDEPGLGLGSFLSEKSDVGVETKLETKPDEKPVEKAVTTPKLDAKTLSSDEKPKDAKADAKAETKPAVLPDPKPNWDDDSNPWKNKATEFDKRFRDTQRSRSELERQVSEERRQRVILEKKLDGTYDSQRDEPPPPDPDAIRYWGAIEGKAQASLAAATRVHGEEKVMKILETYSHVFQNDRNVQERILMSNDPVQAAMDAVAGYDFFKTYGDNPSTIVDKIRKQLETELTPQIAEREAKRMRDELVANRNEPRGIGNVHGSSDATGKQVGKDNAGRQKSLANIFGH
jgi:hypothetical protein